MPERIAFGRVLGAGQHDDELEQVRAQQQLMPQTRLAQLRLDATERVIDAAGVARRQAEQRWSALSTADERAVYATERLERGAGREEPLRVEVEPRQLQVFGAPQAQRLAWAYEEHAARADEALFARGAAQPGPPGGDDEEPTQRRVVEGAIARQRLSHQAGGFGGYSGAFQMSGGHGSRVPEPE